jgi:hypothetical protein
MMGGECCWSEGPVTAYPDQRHLTGVGFEVREAAASYGKRAGKR